MRWLFFILALMWGKRLTAMWLAFSFCLLLVSAMKNTNGTLGVEVIWECLHNFSDPFEAKESTIYWQSIQPPKKVLHLYKKGKEELEHQTKSFKNRTRISFDQISSGNLSLGIQLDLEDDKTQVEVVISGHKEPQKICQRTLNVAALFQKPTVEINQTDVTATCSTKGGFPKPEVKWTSWNHAGVERTLEEYEIWNTITIENGHYSIISKANATGAKTMKCSVYNPTSNETLSESKDVPAQEKKNHAVLVLVLVGVGVLVLVLGFIIKRCNERYQQGPVQDPNVGVELLDQPPPN